MNLNKLLWASAAIVALASCQTASDPYMTLETKSLSLEVDGGTATVKLFTNVYYRVNNDCTDDAGNYWARITDTEVDGDATTFHIKYDANEKSVVRTGTVRFIGDGVTPLKLTLNQKAVAPKGINPNFVELPFTENNTTFTVLDEREWTAECEDKGVVISPASGKGVTNVTVTLPENSTISGRKINVNVAIKGDQTYTLEIDQKKYVGILADWAFKESLSETQKTFADSEEQSVFPGTNGKYVAASTGEGKLEYYAVERTEIFCCCRQVQGCMQTWCRSQRRRRPLCRRNNPWRLLARDRYYGRKSHSCRYQDQVPFHHQDGYGLLYQMDD